MKTWSQMRTRLKHLLAGFIFISFVVGGLATAFSIFAAGISSLQNIETKYEQPVVVVSPPQPSNTIEPQPSKQPVQNWTPSTPVRAEQPNEPLSHMHSPIGDAVDNGGVYLGQRIQEVFGSMLKGVITTLFLEQSDGSSQGGMSNG